MHSMFAVILLTFWGFALSSCGLTTTPTPGGNRDKTYFFTRDTAFQPTPREGTSGATQLIIGDFTNDAFDDLIVLTQSSGMIFYRNITGGGFQPGTLINVTPANFNYASVFQRGLIVAESDTGILRYLSNADGAGGFKLSLAFFQSSTIEATQVLISDPDSTTSDLAVMRASGTHQLGKMGPSNFASITALGDIFPGASGRVQVGLLNDDAFTDFIFMPSSGSPKFYRGTSTGKITATATFTRGSSNNVNEVILSQLTGSSLLDAILLTSAGVEVLENQSSSGGSFSFQNKILVGDVNVVGSRGVAADFLLNDGRQDLYLTRSSAEGVLLFNSSAEALSFENVTSTDGFAVGSQGSGAVSVVSGDFDADNRPDIAELYSNGTVRVYMNTAKGE